MSGVGYVVCAMGCFETENVLSDIEVQLYKLRYVEVEFVYENSRARRRGYTMLKNRVGDGILIS